MGREKVEDRSLFKGNILGERDQIWAALVNEIRGLEGVWETLEFEPLEWLTEVDETIREEEVVGDEDAIVGIKFEGNMTTNGLEEVGKERNTVVGVKSFKYENNNSWKSM